MSLNNFTETYPLSPMQQGMVFHTVYDQTAGFYIQQMVCTLHEDLNIDALQNAWRRVIERHLILRTSFRWDTEAPLQEVHQSVTPVFEEEDWRAQSDEEQTARLREYLKSDRRRGFELDKSPLMRLALFRLAKARYQMIWTFHHALLDGRSHHLVLQEVFNFYEAYRHGQDLEMNEPLPYRHYIEWLGRRDSSNDEAFWRRRLAGLTTPASLDFAGPPTGKGEHDHGLHEIRLQEKTTGALRSLAKRHELTLNTLVQGTWALLLSHHSGAGDVVFGATRACRRSAFSGSFAGADFDGAGDLVGVFINTLPVRLRVLPGTPLIQWLKELRRQNIEVRDYEHTPLLKIQSWSELPKGIPLFESIVVFEDYESNNSLRVLGERWENREFRLHEKAHYPIVVAVYAGTELLIKIQYDRSRFGDRAIERVLKQIRTLLRAFLSAPAENLSCDDVMRYLLNDADEKPIASAAQQNDQESDTDVFPASFGQQRLWFLNQLEPASSFYNIPLVARIRGVLNADVLGRAVNAIVARHEALRTTFATEDGQLLQLIAPEAELTLGLIDLTEMPDAERKTAAERLAKAEAEAPFDLARGPLLRVGLLELRRDEHLLLVTMHHICSDGWSIKVFLDELAVLYQAFLAGESSPLPELTVQYADCAEWQRELLQGEFLEKQLAYWRRQLAGAPAVLELPTDRPRSPVQTFRGDRRTLELSRELRDQLSDLSQREGVTLFMTLLAAFQTLLYRYSGRDDIVVGSPSANRNRSEIEKLIGFFVNTLVLRTDFSGNPGFRELLKRVREVAVGAYMHQEVPFDRLVEELNPDRSLSHSPLFQVIFSLERSSDPEPQIAGLEISWLEIDRGTSKFDLALFVIEESAGLFCILEYDTDLFRDETIARMLDHFQVLLEGIVSNPDNRVGELPLLTATELVRLTTETKIQTSAPLPAPCLHQAFELQTEAAPESMALTFEKQQLTYRELNERANQLAHHLRKQGVGPEVLVGLCLERSVEMIIGILGILKAGGAYLPLDPAYPRDRLSFMLADGGVQIVLTRKHLLQNLSKLTEHNVKVLALDADCTAIARASVENPENQCTPENLAYVMYTSGSTGKPKGVGIPHRGVVRLVKETSYAEFGPEQVFLQFAPLSFDASTFEIWGSLLNGSRLVLMPAGKASLLELGETVQRNAVTTLWLTAGLFQQMVENEFESLRGLRQLIAGGDILSARHVERVARELKECQLINGYGPTENTTFTCCYRVSASERFEGSVPIGLPIPNSTVHVLNGSMEPVPFGAAGELFIGGHGLARGYLNDVTLTAEKFVPSPFHAAGDRMYRTGDRARYRADGNIEFLGRIDRQVKVRGYRIELGEIETVLKQTPGVQECVLVPRIDSQGQTNLVAYIVVDPAGSLKIEGLRSIAEEKLPDYMVPAFFVPLERIPLTANGKIDKQALPMIEKARLDSANLFVAPRTETEKKLAIIWSELLGREQLGIHDNFFELGGHSLLATQVVSRVRDNFGVRLSLRSLFEKPTLAALAELIAGATKEGPGAALPIRRLQRDESSSPTPDSGSS